MEMVQVDELQRLTGYLKGGCSPLGGKKRYPVFIDQSILLQPKVSISAGQRGLQIIIAPNDLIRITDGRTVDISDRPHSVFQEG
jgi:Cys-tRNA(Pro)/Cys-tRNA(Cys) deacylase